MRFWDSSALVPLIVQEPHTAAVRALLAGDARLVCWWGTGVECASAFARRRREGLLGDSAEVEARQSLRDLLEAGDEVAPSATVRTLALRFVRAHPLGAADALQLAAAFLWAGDRPAMPELVTCDARLAAAARVEGFRVLPE